MRGEDQGDVGGVVGGLEELLDAHLLDQDGLGTGDAVAAGQAVIEGDGGLVLLVLLHDLGLDAVLRWRDVVVDLRELHHSCEHLDNNIIITHIN